MTEVRGTGGMLTQAEEGMKLFEAQQGTAAEVDKAAAEKYKAEVETRIATLEAEATLLTGKDKKKERAANGKEVAELKGEQQYVDACKIVKGLESKFGYFVTKAAEAPQVEQVAVAAEEIKPEKAKKDTKKEIKKESAGLSPAETKELETIKHAIVERKAILKEQGMSGGQQNKDEEVVKMVARMNELKEKQEPGSTKKEKDDKKGSKKKTPLSAEEQKEFAQLQNEVEIYKAKLRQEFGYSNKDMKADPDLQDMEANELTRCVRPSSGLHFELAAQAPVLSYGFHRCANLPELCVRLVRRTRFRGAVKKVMAQLRKQNLIQAAVRSFLPDKNEKNESISGDYQLLSSWTLPKFYARLEMMYEVRQNHLDDPSVPLELDKWKDPWAECGVGEVEALQEEHRLQLEELRDRNRKREMEIHEAAQEQLRRLQEELDAAKAELQRRNDQPEVEALPLGHLPPPVSNGRGTPGQAPSLVARCLELGKANKALLESLCVEQREGLDS